LNADLRVAASAACHTLSIEIMVKSTMPIVRLG
jgi:hypothetical protein